MAIKLNSENPKPHRNSSFVVENEIDNVCIEIKRAKTKLQVKTVWSDFLKEMEQEGFSDRTIKKAVSKVRNFVKELDMTKEANRLKHDWICGFKKTTRNGEEKITLGIVRCGKERNKKVTEENENRLNARIEARSEGRFLVTGIDEMIADSVRFLDSWLYTELAAALAFLTGRRTIEVMKTAVFEYVDKNHVLFTGQAKKGDNSEAYIIPVLADAELIIKGLARLRKLKGMATVENEKVHDQCSAAINAMISKRFEAYTTLEKKLTMHDLRRIYARYCLDKFLGNDRFVKTKDSDTFLSRILGHAEADKGKALATGERYQDFKIVY